MRFQVKNPFEEEKKNTYAFALHSCNINNSLLIRFFGLY